MQSGQEEICRAGRIMKNGDRQTNGEEYREVKKLPTGNREMFQEDVMEK